MAFSDLTSSQISEILGLLKQKESLQAQIARIDATVAALESGHPSKGPEKRQVIWRGKRKGSLKVVISDALRAAGKQGLEIDEIAAKVGRKKSSVSVWFYTAGKKIKAIKKLGRGRFAIV